MLTVEVLKLVESFNTQNTLAQAECWLPDTLCWIGESERNTLGTTGAHEGGLQVRVEMSSKRYLYMWVLMGLEVRACVSVRTETLVERESPDTGRSSGSLPRLEPTPSHG
jgi:hypothetical protein